MPAVWLFAAVAAVAFGPASRVEAGCGSYIQFRGTPEMAQNPVARHEHARIAAIGKLTLGSVAPGVLSAYRSHEAADSLPFDQDVPCQGPHCSRQRAPFVPPSVRIVILPTRDLIPLDSDPAASPLRVTSGVLVQRADRPQFTSLGIFRPPRSLA